MDKQRKKVTVEFSYVIDLFTWAINEINSELTDLGLDSIDEEDFVREERMDYADIEGEFEDYRFYFRKTYDITAEELEKLLKDKSVDYEIIS